MTEQEHDPSICQVDDCDECATFYEALKREWEETDPELIYLASPYSDPSPDIRLKRFEAVCRIAAHLMAEGAIVYSPIAHNHPIALIAGLPVGWDYWKRFDTRMIQACDALVVARLNGWEQSVGVTAELEIAQKLGKPIRYVDPKRQAVKW